MSRKITPEAEYRNKKQLGFLGLGKLKGPARHKRGVIRNRLSNDIARYGYAFYEGRKITTVNGIQTDKTWSEQKVEIEAVQKVEIEAVQDFETGLWLEGEQWLAWWKPEMSYDEWEDSRTQAMEILTQPKPSLAQLLTQKAQQR